VMPSSICPRRTALNAPIVGLAPTERARLLVVGADGGVFTFGDAAFAGSLGSVALNARIIGSPPAPWGYWLVVPTAGVFTFGGVPFEGSMGAKHSTHRSPAWPSPRRERYWLVGSDGGFHFGDADFFGRTRSRPGAQPPAERSGVPILRSRPCAAAGSTQRGHARRGPRLKGRESVHPAGKRQQAVAASMSASNEVAASYNCRRRAADDE